MASFFIRHILSIPISIWNSIKIKSFQHGMTFSCIKRLRDVWCQRTIYINDRKNDEKTKKNLLATDISHFTKCHLSRDVLREMHFYFALKSTVISNIALAKTDCNLWLLHCLKLHKGTKRCIDIYLVFFLKFYLKYKEFLTIFFIQFL